MYKRKNPKKKDLDGNMVRLVRALNAFDGITTIGSCGGHPDPGPGQWSQDTFYVKFDLSWDQAGLLALEFLAWAVNHYWSDVNPLGRVMLLPVSPPPYMNGPGTCLSFVIEGYDGADPEQLATALRLLRRRCFAPPWEEADPGLPD
jgi:hypothetical protein